MNTEILLQVSRELSELQQKITKALAAEVDEADAQEVALAREGAAFPGHPIHLNKWSDFFESPSFASVHFNWCEARDFPNGEKGRRFAGCFFKNGRRVMVNPARYFEALEGVQGSDASAQEQ